MGVFPRVQAVPVPSDSVSFRVHEAEVLRYNSGWDMQRPFLFPVLGPAGRGVTRLGHPHDPVTHRHHYSVWVAHHDVDGTDFWTDGPEYGRQVHRTLLALEDGPDSAAARAAIAWVAADGRELMAEERTVRLTELPGGERLIDVHLRLSPVAGAVRLGPTPFGLLAVRVAKTMGVADGGGEMVSSEGASGEEAVFWRPAAWCDYSGPITAEAWNGVAFFCHPSNPGHPPDWHVRSDGWMGACLSRERELLVESGQVLERRYGLYVHDGGAAGAGLPEAYAAFAASEFRPCER